MGASFSTSRKRKSPESSSPPPPDAHEQVQQHKKLKVVAKAPTTTMDVDDYQVFLSFRGPDTRCDFTDVLYQHMDAAGIRVFKDDNEIRVGQQIDVILQAIENSEICVPILSETFASSAWCLREVEKMVEMEKKVMPIFYKVRADDVKLKTDLYKKAMEEHEAKHGKEQVDKWKTALNKVAKIKGIEVSATTRYSEVCKKFTSDVLCELPRREIRCHTNHLVGMDERVESMMKLLDIESNDRRYVVIHGMSGIGKTTLANALFDKLSPKFNNTCFLEDVCKSSCCDLQENLLEDLNPRSIGQSNLMKNKFYKMKVLIVLDDVKKWEHIENLVGSSCWFGAGSIIIVTTQNKDVLNGGALDEDEVLSFEMKTLVYKEAVALFCWYAFRKNGPSVGFELLSREIVEVAGGLPLALRVIGAFLYKKDERVWRDTISRLKKLPFKEVAERLRISYDALENDQKKIFLDIACLSSIAEDKTKAVYMWEACELYPHYGLEVLSSMSLIRIENGSIWMHSQLKYLGKKIVKEESEDPCKRSRIWGHKEAIQILMSTEGKEKIEALVIDDRRGVTLSNEHFASCRELRFLQLDGANITGDFDNLLPNLRWLSWKYCPAILSATNLFMKNLVNLDLSDSFIDESWGGWKLIQNLNNLKVLDLSRCQSLTRTPEFSENNSLERLVLSHCYELREIHGSIGKLKKLKYLELRSCDSLGGLPDEIGCLVNLEELYASRSSDSVKTLFKLPNSIGCLKSLLYLELEGFAIKLPNSLGRLVKLKKLHVSGGTNLDELLQSLGSLQELISLRLTKGTVKKIPAVIGKLEKLEYLYLDGVLEEVPAEVFGLPSLRSLELRNSSISTLPLTISQHKLLETLDLGTNHVLQELPDLPLSLTSLSVESRSLRKIANLSSSNLAGLHLLGADDYGWLEEMPEYSKFEGIEKLIKMEKLYLGIATAKRILLQSDLGSLTSLWSLTLDFQLADSFSDAPLLLPSASNSSLDIISQGSRLGLKFPNLSSLKIQQVEFMNCLIKDGLDSLGIQHLDNLNDVIISNCSAELIEQTCLMKNLRSLSIWKCKEVVEITGLGSLVSLRRLWIDGCTSLERLENLSKLENLSNITLCLCPKLRTIEGIEGLSLSSLIIETCGSLQNRDELRKRCEEGAYIRDSTWSRTRHQFRGISRAPVPLPVKDSTRDSTGSLTTSQTSHKRHPAQLYYYK